MVNLELAEMIRNLVALVVAYFPTIMVAGYGQAWIAKKMGDDTAEQLGYLTFDPTVHFNWLGFTLLVLFGYGWGQMIPVNPFRIHGPRRSRKLGLIFFSPAIIHFLLAIISLLALIVLGGFLFKSPTAQLLPMGSSLFIALKFIVQRFLLLNVLLAALFFVYGLARLLVLLFASDLDQYSRSAELIYIALIILFVFFVISYVQQAVMILILFIEWVINALFGAL